MNPQLEPEKKPFNYITAPGVEVDSHQVNEDGSGSAMLRSYEHAGKSTNVPLDKARMDVLLGKESDPDIRNKNLIQKYKPANLSKTLGTAVAGLGESFRNQAGKGGWDRAALYGGIAALAGGGYGVMTGDNGIANRLGNGLKYGGLAVGGLGLAALLYKLVGMTNHKVMPTYVSGVPALGTVKKASFGKSFSDITAIIANDTQLSFTEKAEMLQAIQRLTPGDKSQLSDMLWTAGGAGAGALIARFLGAKGLLGTGIGAILGGLGGWAFGGPPAPRLTASGLISSNNFR